MKVTKWVTVEKEIEVDVDMADVFAQLADEMADERQTEDPSPCRRLLGTLSHVLVFLRDMPDGTISRVPDGARKTISDAMSAAAGRWAPGESRI